MNKLFTKIAGISLGLAMALGVGVVAAKNSGDIEPVQAAEQSVTFSLTSSTNRTTISTSLIKYQSNNVSFSIIKGTGTNVNNYCPGGSTNNTTQTRVYNGNSVEFKAPSGKVITKVDVTATSGSYFAGLDTAANYSPTPTMGTNGSTTTATFASAVQTQTVTANTTGTGRLTAVKIYYDDPSAEPTLAVNKSSVTVAKGYDATFVVTTANLSSSFSVSGGNNSYFTTSYTASSTDGEHVVTLRGVGVTTSPIALTISATGATSQTVNVSVEEPSLYEKVTAGSEIKAGREIVIGVADGTSILGKYVSGNNCPALTNVPADDGKLISTYLPNGYALLTIGGTSGKWTLTDQDDNIYYGVSDDNQLRSSASATDTWSISIAANGVATITSAASSRSIKKNTSNSLFNTYASGQTDVCVYMVPSTDPEIQVAVTGSQSLGIGETATLTATKLNGASGTINWATSNSSILALSAVTGDEVTVTAGSTLGNATITATLTGCDDVEATFTVRRGSATEPYTVAQARTAIDGSDAGAKTGVYVSGIVSQVDTLNSDNSITYWISDNGTATNQMEVYKGFAGPDVEFSSLDDLQLGDEVVVYGDLKKYTPQSGDPIYEFNSGNYLYSHNRPVIELATITAIEGTLSANSGDASWDLSGLAVKGTYTGSATIVDVTSLVNLSTDDIPGTPESTTVRNVSVTATGKDDSSITLTQNVSGTITVMSSIVAAGQYRIQATRDDVVYYLQENGSSNAPLAVTDFWEATIFTFTLVDDNTYTISNGDNFLYTTNTNNGVRFGSPQDSANKNWIIETGADSLEGSFNIVGCSGSRYLSLYDGADWRAYNSATASNRLENTDLQAFNATQFAVDFLSTYTSGCIADGGYTAANMKWDIASEQYAELSSSEKTILKGATASQSGNLVEQAVARYDYIVGKYGTSTFADFMTRNPSLLSNSRFAVGLANDTNSTSIIIVISMVSLTAAGAYFLFRKKKHQ